MIKKSITLFLTIFLILLILNPIHAELDPTTIAKDYSGGIDSETGLPQEIKKVTDKEYLKQEFKTTTLGKFFTPFFTFTEKIFSIFNPFWKLTLETEFSWSWIFFLSFFIWIALIIILYSPSKAFIDLNPLLILLFSAVIATIIGRAGVISQTTKMLMTMLTNIWLVGLSFLIGIILLIVYYQIMKRLEKDFKKSSKKEKREQAQEKIEAAGESAEKFLDN
ncbi:hypothetical protein HOE04_04865 [archaeon]|jgi:hypothetical protein|nr:hypothetical protein [Candidatus Woesearchaeota archaeon]MBT4166343.1 hypothetical protein [archaeon]